MKTKLKLHLLFLALAVIAFPSVAAEAFSGTNSIHGVVRLINADPDIVALLGPPGDQGMTQMVIYAYTDPPNPLSASKYIDEADRLAQPYEITVSAGNTPLTYHVYAEVVLDGVAEEYWTAIGTAAPVTSNSAPAVLDFDESIALVELRYENSLSQPVAVNAARVKVSETATSRVRARLHTQPQGNTNNFLVVPSGVEIELTVEVDTGTDLYLDRLTHTESHIMTLTCEEKPVLTITLPPAAALGRIIGNANLVGEIEPATEGYLELLGRPVMRAQGPSLNQRYGVLDPDPIPLDGTRPFALEGLVPSTLTERWNVFAKMHFGEDYRFEYFRTPGLGQGANPGVEVTGGSTSDLSDVFVMTPARLVGRITLSGPPEFPGTASGLRGLVRAADYDADTNGIPDGVGVSGIGGSYAIATGVDQLAPGATLTTAGGSATASFAGAFNPLTFAFEGDYETVVGMLDDEPGVWKYDGLNLAFLHPGTNGAPYVNESLYVVEDVPWQGVLAPGDRVTNDVRYGFAEVCLRIRSATPFFYPRIVSMYGGLNGLSSQGGLRAYHVGIGNASSPPYTADAAVFEAIVTCYVPEGTYTLQPAISIPDPDGNVSDTQLPAVSITVVAGERYCVEDCIQLTIEPPICTPNYGFLARANAVSCDGTLTNLSLRASPTFDPSIRLGYSDIRILIGSRTNLTTANGLFPEFDGFPRSYYENILYTATAVDKQGRIATRQIIAHYDLTPPTVNCPGDITVTSPDGSDVAVDFTVTATDNNPEPLLGPTCIPPSGSIFPLGITIVTCTASDLCRNTNTCAFNVIVQLPVTNCALGIALTQSSPPFITLTWDCAATLQCAPSPTGPWTSLTGVTSPYETPANGPKKFYRLCISGDCSGDVVSNCNPPGLLAHEPFDYTAGSALDTLNGGTGFSGPWSATINGPNYFVAGSSLTFSPLCVSGGRMTSAVGHTQMARTLASSFGADGTTRYFSFLLRPEGVMNGGDLGGFHGSQLQGGPGAQALFIGKPGGAGGGVLAPYVLEEVGGAGQVLSSATPVIGETVLLVVKAEFAAGNDTFTLYVNPAPGSPEPATGAVKSDLDLGTWNSVLIYSGGEFSLDELRVGETFESVTPR